jgi:pyruvate/2-oxoglutarate dehydrogenase complex dihydrolipoamide acyltransferase (E2) component
MKNLYVPIAAVLGIFIACSSQAAEKPLPAQADQKQPIKVWTNEDMDQLRERGLISIVGQEPTATSEQTQAEPESPVYDSMFDDPSWYADEAADLRAELDRRQAALNEQLTAIARAHDRITQPGVALDKPSVGGTPQEGVQILQEDVQEMQDQLDELGDLARQHDIQPGVLRG